MKNFLRMSIVFLFAGTIVLSNSAAGHLSYCFIVCNKGERYNNENEAPVLYGTDLIIVPD